MSILILESGLLTSVQDKGRYGYQQYGVSPGGPMDYQSFAKSNLLVGNDENEATLEITYSGPKILFEQEAVIAIAGGDLSPLLDGIPIDMCKAVQVPKGSVLSFRGMKNGCRAYIAFAGGLDVPLVMGSKATLIRNHMGGVEGRAIVKGDRISLIAPKYSLLNLESRRTNIEQFPKGEIVLRTVRGPQDDCFTKESVRKFYCSSYQITNEFDRMGCRLQGDAISHIKDGNIITDGIAFGSIQVPSNGQPIIMLADRQSTGGYTKIATVITVDLQKIAQSLPGYRVRFVEVSIEVAQQLYLKSRKEIYELKSQLERKQNV